MNAQRIGSLPISTSHLSETLQPAPIEPAWIRAGQPVARNAVLWTGSDRTAFTILWECSAGEFDWHYEFDETIHILSGAIVLETEGQPATRYGVGDAVFFPKGAVVRWRIDDHVRKLAFCHYPPPYPVALGLRALRRVMRLVRPGATGGSLAPANL